MPVNQPLIIKSGMEQTRRHTTGHLQKKSLLKSLARVKLPQGSKMALTTLPVMVNLRLTTMMAMAVKKLDVGEILTLVLHQV